VDQDTIVARTLIAQKKRQQALLALQRRRLSENQLASIQAYLMNVEGMVRQLCACVLACVVFAEGMCAL
jgi:hypothetical protein